MAKTLELSPEGVTALKASVEMMVDAALALTTDHEGDHRQLFDTLTLLDAMRDAGIPTAAERRRDELVRTLDYVAAL